MAFIGIAIDANFKDIFAIYQFLLILNWKYIYEELIMKAKNILEYLNTKRNNLLIYANEAIDLINRELSIALKNISEYKTTLIKSQ